MNEEFCHLTHINSHEELSLYELLPDAVWIFDLDEYAWWWGNAKAISFWGLNNLDELLQKDISGDTQGAKDRIKQTFEITAKKGLTTDPWTTYPNGKPKTVSIRHRACLIGPERHRGIIAYVNEEVHLSEEPETLLLAEAMRYTNVLVTIFTLDGYPIIQNPTAIKSYKTTNDAVTEEHISPFVARFFDPEEGKKCLLDIKHNDGGHYTYKMYTVNGVKIHTLDIRKTRHPLTGDFLFMVAEYDVTQLHHALENARISQDKLRAMAHNDALTGISSLHYITERAPAVLSQASRLNHQVAVMFIDIDGFKPVNDTWGHNVGDNTLIEIAKRLKSVVRSSDLVGRIGGDEFIILITDVVDQQNVITVAKKLVDIIAQPLTFPEAIVQVSASIGISLYPDGGNNIEALIKLADKRMYQAKKSGKNRYCYD